MKKLPPCLILDQRWFASIIINFQKAINLCFRGMNVLEFHPSKFISTPSRKFMLPIIIQVDEVINQDLLSITPSRKLIFIRDNFTCQYCGRELSLSQCTIDHVIPKSKGGDWSWENLVTACPRCNQSKGDQIWKPLKTPSRPLPIEISLSQWHKHLDDETIEIWSQYLSTKLRRVLLEGVLD
jgi:hypothetical protein